MFKALWKSENALNYLRERGLKDETIKELRLGLSPKNLIAIPIIADGKLVCIKYRSIPPAEKQYSRETGCPSYIFNGDFIEKGKAVVLTEGEFDAMIGYQWGMVAVSGITGASSFTPEEMKQLDKADKVIVCYDSDEAGQKGAHKLIDRLGLERCLNIVLPTKDLNEFFLQGHTKEEFTQLIKEADKVKPENVMSFSELMSELKNQDGATGLATGYDQLDSVFSGLGAGKLSVIAADTGIGKSTFGLNIFRNMCLNGTPVMIFSLENQPIETVKRMASMMANKPFNKITTQELQDIEDMYNALPMYFYFAGDKDTDMSTVRAVSIAAKKYYGVEAILVDHIHFFARNPNNVTQELSLLVLQMKRLAVSLAVPIVAISHISRKDKEGRVPTIHDLKGSSSIEQDADQVIVLWRDVQALDIPDQVVDEFEKIETLKKQSRMMVRIQKDRNGPGYGDFWFHYDMATGLITERV